MSRSRKSYAPLLLVVVTAVAAAIILSWLAGLVLGVEIVPADEGPYRPWQLVQLDITGATPDQLKTAAVHHWPKDTASVRAGYDWSGEPYLLFQGAAAGSYWLAVCVPVDGGLETAEITVEVGGAGPQPNPEPGPGPSPPPDPAPAPAPPVDWLTALSKWTAEKAAETMPGKTDEAKKWAGAIRKTAAEAAGGKHPDWRVFRETMKDRAFTALGYSSAVEWNDKFDDPFLTPRIEKEMKAHEIKTPEDAAAMWSAVADGLDRMGEFTTKGFSTKRADPISLLIIGGPDCPHCKTTLKAAEDLWRQGYRIYYASIADPKYRRLIARYNVSRIPHIVMRIDGKTWQTNVGALGSCALRNWFEEARRYRNGLIESDPSLRRTTDGGSMPVEVVR